MIFCTDEERHAIEQAVHASQGAERSIVRISDCSERLGASFPAGSTAWLVISESTQCEHTPRCRRYDQVYSYQGHYVVIAQRDLDRTSVAEVIDRLSKKIIMENMRIGG